ncbi:TRAP transporter small permease [Martelella radicis]|uniref:TRAP transporter small permease protein n=1 Tax=Martelella radicis TaxID=1397476 RepID=A0A7W6KMX7_9HYPH|nr:TRAP transporter small permease [Martelella radicis]MBB4124142.1 TRAP-type C4-dicarboxylate transport system permease small subunit [Martelella radicis]
MPNLVKSLDLSERLLTVLCVVAFIAMFVLGIATVVFRFIIESSLAFPDELIRYLFVWMIALGSAVAFRRNMHAAIGVVVERFPVRLKRGSLLFSTGCSLVFFVLVFWYGLHLMLRVRPQISPALEISMAWVYAAIPVGMAFLAVYAVELFVRQTRAPADELTAQSA